MLKLGYRGFEVRPEARCLAIRRGPAPAPAYYPATLHHARASLPESHLHDLVIFNRRKRPPQQLKYLPVVGEVHNAARLQFPSMNVTRRPRGMSM
jgi:hypothetical protein